MASPTVSAVADAGVELRSAHGGLTTQLLVHPQTFLLPEDEPRRERPRPAELRAADYDDKFDFDTLFFDVFRSGKDVIAIGPPLLNLGERATQWHYDADGSGVRTPRFVALDRSHRAVFRHFAGAELGVTAASSARMSRVVGADLSHHFAGTRAMMTLQLDNDLEWVGDWVRWHQRAQGTDAVIVYDNGSSRYSLDQLLESISLPGIRVAAVVEWGFRYGPQGSDTVPWDSDFTQYGAIEHARRRMLREASGMLSNDIDELVFPLNGRDVYRAAAESAFGMARFHGRWAYTDPTAPPASPLHRDCRWVRTLDEPAGRKWCAVPSRIPDRAQLKVHGADGVPAPPDWTSGYWHMRQISTSWKLDRAGFEHPAESYSREPVLEQQLTDFLNPGEHHTAEGTPRGATSRPGVLVRRAADLLSHAYRHFRHYVHRLRTTG